MPKRVGLIAQHALLRLQGISTDCSDGEDSDSNGKDALASNKEVEPDSTGEESCVDSAYEDNDSQNQVQVNPDLIEKDGLQGRLYQQNIMSFKSGSTAFAVRRMNESTHFHLFAFCLTRQCSEISKNAL